MYILYTYGFLLSSHICEIIPSLYYACVFVRSLFLRSFYTCCCHTLFFHNKSKLTLQQKLTIITQGKNPKCKRKNPEHVDNIHMDVKEKKIRTKMNYALKNAGFICEDLNNGDRTFQSKKTYSM